MNGTSVGAPGGAGAFAADITPLLEARNEVVIDAASGEELGAVRLEVRKA